MGLVDLKLKVGQYIDTYKIVQKLGQGGMGAVYKVQSNDGTFFALKIMIRREGLAKEALERFKREVQLLSKIELNNIVKIHDVGIWNENPYFVMDFLDGITLGEYFQRKKRLDHVEALQIVWRIALVLAALHRQGIVHRDIKPDNIMIVDKRPYLMDFSIARSEDEEQRLTEAGAIIGTANYMPIEQAKGQLKSIGPWSDVYALGATLFHIVTGVLPFEAKSRVEVLLKVNQENLPSIQRYNRKAPKEIDWIIQKATAKKISDRYPNAEAFANDLRAAIHNKKVSVSNPNFIQWNNAKLPILIGLIFVLLFIFIFFSKNIFIINSNSNSTNIVEPPKNTNPLNQSHQSTSHSSTNKPENIGKPPVKPISTTDNNSQANDKNPILANPDFDFENEKKDPIKTNTGANISASRIVMRWDQCKDFAIKNKVKPERFQQLRQQIVGIDREITLYSNDYKKLDNLYWELAQCYQEIGRYGDELNYLIGIQNPNATMLLRRLECLEMMDMVGYMRYNLDLLAKFPEYKKEQEHYQKILQKVQLPPPFSSGYNIQLLHTFSYAAAYNWEVKNNPALVNAMNAIFAEAENFKELKTAIRCIQILMAIKYNSLNAVQNLLNTIGDNRNYTNEINYVKAIYFFHLKKFSQSLLLFEQMEKDIKASNCEAEFTAMVSLYLNYLRTNPPPKELPSWAISQLNKGMDVILVVLKIKALRTISLVWTTDFPQATALSQTFIYLECRYIHITHYRLACCYLIREEYKLAEKHLTIANNFGYLGDEVTFTLGELYYKTKRYTEAKSCFETCIQNAVNLETPLVQKSKNYLKELSKIE